MYLGAPMLGAYTFTMFMSSWCILPLSIMKCPSGSLFMAYVLKSIFSDIIIAVPAFFFLSVCIEYFFKPFTFSLCRSFVLRWVSCRQQMCGSCFLIHSAILCLWLQHLIYFHYCYYWWVLIHCHFTPFVSLFLSLSVFVFLFLKQSL